MVKSLVHNKANPDVTRQKNVPFMDRFAEIDSGQYLSDGWPRNRKLTPADQHEVALQEAFGTLHE